MNKIKPCLSHIIDLTQNEIRIKKNNEKQLITTEKKFHDLKLEKINLETEIKILCTHIGKFKTTEAETKNTESDNTLPITFHCADIYDDNNLEHLENIIAECSQKLKDERNTENIHSILRDLDIENKYEEIDYQENLEVHNNLKELNQCLPKEDIIQIII